MLHLHVSLAKEQFEWYAQRQLQILSELIEEYGQTMDVTLDKFGTEQSRQTDKSATKMVQSYETGKRDGAGCLCCCLRWVPDIEHSLA